MSERIYVFDTVGDVITSIKTLLDNPDDADRFEQEYIEKIYKQNTEGWTRERCREVFLHNVGYCAGYISVSAMSAVEELFGARHPMIS
jgi:hypothetical protein